MKIGVFTVLFAERPFEEALDLIQESGCEAVEISTGGAPGNAHCDLDTLVDNSEAQQAWMDEITCPWPTEYLEILNWQWEEVAKPYWSEAGMFAADNNVRVAIELHPGFIGYHTESFWKLREIGDDAIGVDFAPSHLFWQGMEPLTCIRELGDAVLHVHMKGTWLDEPNIRRNGVLDTKEYTQEKDRSWIFRTVGFGHGQEFWRSMVSELRLAGYDGALSIEHEDSLLSIDEGFNRAVNFLKDVVIREQPGAAWWV